MQVFWLHLGFCLRFPSINTMPESIKEREITMAVRRRKRFFSVLSIPSNNIAITAIATDTFGKGGNITDGETLVSANGTFILGFFSPPGESRNRYLGIWFSISPDVVCWVANRDKPLNGTSGLLSFESGSLLLVDRSSGVTAWSSNSSSADPAAAQLLESGNLIVRDQSNGLIVWQSFEHPSDTLLPGMKMGRSNSSGAEWDLTPWHSADDPSPGTFRFISEVNGLLEIVLLDRGVRVYRTGVWNGLRFSGVTEASTYTDLFEFEVTVNPWEATFGYIAKPGAPLSRIAVTSDGLVKRLVWGASKRIWVTYYQGPRDVCDSYGKCGPFGICNANAPSSSFCSCIEGFSPVSPKEWSGKETSDGCQRKIPLDCGGNNRSTTDGFLMLPGIKLPDTRNASVDTSITVEQCSANCLANCSCVAYAPADIHDGAAGSGCIMWTQKIVDLRYVDGGQDLYLRLPQQELGGHTKGKNHTTMIAMVSIVVAIGFAFLIITFRVIIRKILGHTQTAPDARVPSLRLCTIKMATRNFSKKRVIGQGGFSTVYEGKLPKGHCALQGMRHRTVAVKRMHNKSKIKVPLDVQPDENVLKEIMRSFDREVNLMSQLPHHENVARLLGLCNEKNERILLYEYAHRRSLDAYIFGRTQEMRTRLSWEMRLEIIQGIAKGLTHLHEGSNDNTVIHRDLKASNVFLDDKWVAKVADFGTARIFTDQTGTWSSVVIGTIGYIAPEYLQNAGDLTLKCDVYSFGVTLLSIISGKNVAAPTFLRSARELWRENNIMPFIESEIEPPSSIDLESAIRRCIRIGILCVQETPDHRPTMPRVVELLANSSIELPQLNSHVLNVGTLLTVLEEVDDLPNQQETDQAQDAGEDEQNQSTTREITEVL